MELNDLLVRRADEVYVQSEDFLRSLWPALEECGRFYNIISSLAKTANDNYRILRQSFDKDDQPLMAWSCRNLLEIVIYTKYVLISKSNADEFAEDRLIDGSQIVTALKEFQMHLNPNFDVSAFDLVLARYSQKMKEESIKLRNFRRIEDLAKSVDMSVEYKSLNKICSKLVHPTAWSILTSDNALERFPEARRILFSCGAKYFAEVFMEIRKRVKEWGLRYQPSPQSDSSNSDPEKL